MLIRKTIEYEDENHALAGWLVYENGESNPASPGIVLFHEFMGLGTCLERHLENLAALGYVVFAADLYGKGIRPGNAQTALMFSRPLRDDRHAMRQRGKAAFNCPRRLWRVDPEKITALGSIQPPTR